MQQADKFGRTRTAYVSILEENQEKIKEMKPAKKSSKK